MGFDLSVIENMLWIIIPLLIVQFTLILIAFIDWNKNKEYLGQNKLVWLAIICLVNTIGPIIYLIYSNRKLKGEIQEFEELDEWRA
ncbi:MAG: PLDc N-terminal domain-containing protein [Candidatus Hodarchaeales archaeon]